MAQGKESNGDRNEVGVNWRCTGRQERSGIEHLHMDVIMEGHIGLKERMDIA